MRGLGRYACAAALARLADEMVGIAVVLLVLARTGDPVLAGAAVAGYTLPAVLTGPLLGAWLAGARRPRLALLGNEILLALVVLGLVAGAGRVPAVAVVGLTTLAGLCLPLTSGGFSSLVPRLAEGQRLARANIVDAVTFNIAALGGPAVAGLLAGTLGPAAAVGAIAIASLLAAIATLALPIRALSVAGEQQTSASALLTTARAGLAHLLRTPPLRAATLTSVLAYAFLGLLVVALPLHTAALGAPAGDAGFVWAAVEVGGMAATLLLSPRLRSTAPERIVFGAVAAYGVALALWPLASGLGWLLASAVLAGFADGPALPALFATRQRYSPAPLLAQVATTGASLKIAALALGSAAGGLLVPWLGARRMILLVAAGQLVAAGIGRLTTSGSASPPPADVPASTAP
ncbi:MAG TPA: MFS transporter [Pseudonocardiaceae bacterium]|nr:MFS transporter [Pseudonocardiaceae bacterium]